MIYIVMGSTGEYSDRREWICKAYRDEDKAKDLVLFYEKKLLELDLKTDRYWKNGYNEKENKIQLMREHDPKFDYDYTGTRYWLEVVEFDE